MEILSNGYDAPFFWTWFLLWTRIIGVLSSLVGIGTEQVPSIFRLTAASFLSFTVALAISARAPLPDQLVAGGAMVIFEFLLGYLIGSIPTLILTGVSVAGQATNGIIGLSQAFMIDPSLGEHVTVFARLQMLIAVIVFLTIDGHHAVLRAATGVGSNLPIGAFRIDGELTLFLVDRFADAFELALTLTAPVIVTVLVTQFVLGLITRAVPQMNVFIMSLPLTILLGFFVIAFTFTSLGEHITAALIPLEEHLATVTTKP